MKWKHRVLNLVDIQEVKMKQKQKYYDHDLYQ